ncbi:MAG: hypothetical protein ABJB69_04070 [Spartobacteria bacterium]
MRKLFLSILCLSILPAVAFGGARRFTFVYETPTTAPGKIEVENWVTWKTHTPADSSFDQVDFRHEIEFGITPRLQAAVYIADWFYADDRDHSEVGYKASALELVYNFSNPVTDPLGFSVYEEIKAGDHLFELESKIIAQKNFGRWVVAYNATLAATWEDVDLAQRSGEFAQSAGISYEISPRWSVGGEVLHEVAFPDWSESGESVAWLGPNVSVRVGSWFATVTALSQVTDVADEPNFELRTIVGYSF